MNYEIHYDELALDFLKNLNEELRSRIFEKIESTQDTPHHFFVRLKGRIEYKLRIGNYRVIADIDDNSQIIHVKLIGHRKNVYE